MNIDTKRVRQVLKDFDFKRLFIEDLNWSYCHTRPIELEIDGKLAIVEPLAEIGGVVAYQAVLKNSGSIPEIGMRRKIENKIKKLTHEHIIIFTDQKKENSVWQWVRRERGVQTGVMEHRFHRDQPGDSLLVKLDGIAFDIKEMDNSGNVKVIVSSSIVCSCRMVVL